MKSIEDLKAIRKSAQEALRLRDGKERTSITVAMGTCGIAAGARRVMMALIDELAKRERSDILVSQTGCAGFCEKEPLVTVRAPGQPDVVYGYLDERKAREVVVKHAINGLVVTEYVVQAERGGS